MDTSKQKPDLMSSSRGAADGGKRILAHLEHGPKAAAKPPRTGGWTIDGWTVGLGLLLATMCTVAWLVHENTLTPRSFAHNRSGSASTYVARQPAEMVEQQAATAEPVEQPAAIVNEIVRPSPAAENHPSPTPSSTAGPALARAEAPRAAGTPRRQAGAAGTTAAAVAAARLPATRAAAVAPQAASGDTDVALLTALVAHSSKPTMVLPERNRDVVERQDGDSTAQLLARCKQLGLIEGMLCRSRICSGRWDADPACNAPSR